MEASDDNECLMERKMPNLYLCENILENWSVAHKKQMLNFLIVFSKMLK